MTRPALLVSRGALGSTLGLRIIGVAVFVAVLVAGIASAVAVAAVQRTAREANTARLQQQADLLQNELGQPDGDATSRLQLITVLAGQGFEVVVFTGSEVESGAQRAVAVVRAAGLLTPDPTLPASRSVSLRGNGWLLEARQIPNEASAFAVVADADEGAVSTRVLLRRIVIAMLIGLGAAIPVALILARVVTRPLRRTAELANAIGAGRRDARVAVTGPTEVREVARALNQLADALAGSESGQQRFLASVSHELRTPLAAVSGLSDALADGLIPADEVARIGQTIRAEAARLERLVADLLDLARLGTDEFGLDLQPVDVQTVVASMNTAWRVRCDQRSVPLAILTEPRPTFALVDERRLRQVLDGLSENALRVLPPDQPLIVESYRLELAGQPCIRIEIRDGGTGLTEDDYRVAFQPGVLHERYRRLRPVGAGLGLALAHGLVSRMGGTLTVGPAAEGGVCCTITLPALPAPQKGPHAH